MSFLSTKDAVLDPSCMAHVSSATRSGISQTDVVNALIRSYTNLPGEVALLAGWLKELQGDTKEHREGVVKAVVDSVEECLVESFSEDVAKGILNMDKASLAWIDGVLKEPEVRACETRRTRQ